MFCTNCGKRIEDDSKFCQFCGKKIDFKEEKDSYPRVLDRYKTEYISYPKEQDRLKRDLSIGRFFYNHWKKALFIIIIALIIWGIISDIGVETRRFPKLAGPKIVTFEWKYRGSEYSITETLYETIYNYYNSSPEKHCWIKEEENFEICLKGFLEEAKEDNTISKIALDIKALASKNGLDDDGLVELTVAFVQSIPYDEDKFALVMYPNNPEDLYPAYPYEVLYNNKGICGGKTFLATSLLEELGYGVALFYYEPVVEGEVGHIAPAVKCPIEYSSYNSGYCHSEVTEKDFKIGEMPINIEAGVAKTRTTINLFGEGKNASDFGESELKDAEIYVIADGDSYQEIIKTAQIMQRIGILERELNKLETILSLLENGVEQLENSVNYYNQQAEAAYRRHEIFGDHASYNEYRRLFSQYESTYNKYESKVNEHDREVVRYNNLVEEYNSLIEDFYK